MYLSDFRNWLAGYESSFKDGHPSAEEWLVIQSRLALVDKLEPPGRVAVPTPYGTVVVEEHRTVPPGTPRYPVRSR
jgi:hypothetical protein